MKKLICICFVSLFLYGQILEIPQREPDIEKMFDYVLPVVNEIGFGGGVAIAKDRVITANHLIKGKVEVNGLKSKVLFQDERNDIALLEVEGKLKRAKIASSCKVGQEVWIVGFPNGVKCVIHGYIASINENFNMIDAIICKGMSGGGVFNKDAELIGIISGGVGVPIPIGIGASLKKIKEVVK